MSPNAGSQPRPVKRRQSILSLVRPFTTGGDHFGGSQHARPHTGIWNQRDDGKDREIVSQFPIPDPLPDTVYHPSVTIDSPEPGPSSDSKPKRHHSKSFSGLRNGVGGLRAVARRLSVSRKHKPPKQIPDMPGTEGGAETQHGQSKLSGSQRAPRKSSVSDLNVSGQSHPGTVIVPIPGSGSEPPVVPGDLSRGAAARAAAAAQNEMIKAERVRSNSTDRRVDDGLGVKPSLDYESGIEINMEDHADISDDELNVVRKGECFLVENQLLIIIISVRVLIVPRPVPSFTSRTHGAGARLPRRGVVEECGIGVAWLEYTGIITPRLEGGFPARVPAPSDVVGKECR